MDETSSTNIYDKPLEAFITIDCENKSQLLSFSIMNDESKE